MIDETRQVLDMVANGSITPDQAAELLDALDDRPTGGAGVQVLAPPSRERRRGRKRHIMNAKLAELTDARIHGVDAAFIREMQGLGYSDLSLKELTELKIHDVDSAFVAEMAKFGFTGLSAEELIELSIAGIDEEFIREMREFGYNDPSAGQVLQVHSEGGTSRQNTEEEAR